MEWRGKGIARQKTECMPYFTYYIYTDFFCLLSKLIQLIHPR